MSGNKKNDNYIKQGTILAAASLIVRIIGMLYRFPMSNIIGEEGNGLYSVAFEIYDIMLIISSYSLPLAISKIISAMKGRREHKRILKTFRCAFTFAFVAGLTAGLVLFFGAPFFESELAGGKYTGLALPLRVLAPTVFLVALMGALRGLYQGKGAMMPTAVSQIVEQIVNAGVSIFAAYVLIKTHQGSAQLAGWGAAGGTMGTLFGALSGFLILAAIYLIYRPILIKNARKDRISRPEDSKGIYKLILLTSIPIILSQTVYQISGIIDYSLFGSIEAQRGLSDVAIKNATGLYSTKYRLLISVPIAIATAMSSSILPSVASSFAVRDYDSMERKIKLGIKFNMIIAFPCFIGLAVLSKPVLMMLFPTQDYISGSYLLTIGSIAVVFYAISNITGAVLQGIDKMRLPVIHSAIALIIHIILVFVLLKTTNLGIISLVIGNVIFPVIVAALNLRAIMSYTGYRQEYVKTFGVPLISAFVMGIACFIVYKGLYAVLPYNWLVLLFTIAIAILVYFTLYFMLRGADKEEIYEFPMGARIVRLAQKFHMI